MMQGISWICADGTRIVGDSFGAPDAPLIIFGHGGGQTRRAWQRSAEQVAACGFRAVTYDMRGHGQSDRAPPGGYDEDGLIQDIAAIVEGCNDAHPILVGASAGGMAALAAIGSGRIAARGLCLVDIATRTERAGYDRIRAFMLAGTAGFASLDDAATALAAYRGESHRGAVSGLAKVLNQDPDGRYRWHWDADFLAARHAEIDTREERLERYARALGCPVLLIRGGSSDMVSPEGAQTFLNLCPHARYVDIAGAGHMVAGDGNDTFSDALLSFLGDTRGIGAAGH